MICSHVFYTSKRRHARKQRSMIGKDNFQLNIIKLKYFQPLLQHTSKLPNTSFSKLELGVKYIKSQR